MINSNFVYIAVLFQFFGGLSYLVDTVKGKIQPNKVSWLLWSIVPFIAFFAEIAKGVGVQSLSTFIVGFTPLSIFIASFVNKRAFWKIETIDIVCGALSCFGLLVWYFTKEPNTAIIFSITADAFASFPTLRKSFLHPQSENHWVYSMGIITMGITLLTITSWNFATYAYPAYICIMNSFIIINITLKPSRLFDL